MYKFSTTYGGKISNFMLQWQELLTDSNFFLSGYSTTNFIKMVELQTDMCELDNKKTVNAFNFYSSNKYNSYVRKYIKIPEIMASVGGLIKACSVVIVLFYNVYLNVYRNEFLINKIINTKLLTSSNIEKKIIRTNNDIIVHTSLAILKNKGINSHNKIDN